MNTAVDDPRTKFPWFDLWYAIKYLEALHEHLAKVPPRAAKTSEANYAEMEIKTLFHAVRTGLATIEYGQPTDEQYNDLKDNVFVQLSLMPDVVPKSLTATATELHLLWRFRDAADAPDAVFASKTVRDAFQAALQAGPPSFIEDFAKAHAA